MPDRTQLNIKIDAKTHWLANLAARYQGLTLAEFVEGLIERGITREAVLSDSFNESRAKEPVELWNEALWSEDESTRLFHLASSSAMDLMTGSQRELWADFLIAAAKEGKKSNLSNFRRHQALLEGVK